MVIEIVLELSIPFLHSPFAKSLVYLDFLMDRTVRGPVSSFMAVERFFGHPKCDYRSVSP